jgi:hypothetical protein
LALTDKDANLKMRLDYWYAKSLYNIGDYKIALDLGNTEVEKFLKSYPQLSKEFSSISKIDKEAKVSTFIDEKEVSSI